MVRPDYVSLIVTQVTDWEAQNKIGPGGLPFSGMVITNLKTTGDEMYLLGNCFADAFYLFEFTPVEFIDEIEAPDGEIDRLYRVNLKLRPLSIHLSHLL